MTGALLLISAGLWGLMLWRGLRHRGALGTLIAALAAYGLLDYVGRPAVLVYTHPAPKFGDPIADLRIVTQYDFYVDQMLKAILPGLVTLCAGTLLALYLANRRSRVTQAPTVPVDRTTSTLPLGFLFLVGWGARLASYHFASSSVLNTLAIIPAVSVAYFLIYKRVSAQWALFFIGSEMLWSVLSASKAPILAVVLWLLIRQLSERGSRFPWRRLVVTLVVALFAFLAIAEVKVSTGRLRASSEYAASYPGPVRPVLPVIARFDSFFQFTDAYLAGASTWLTPEQVAVHFVKTLVPSFVLPGNVRPKIAGSLWEPGVRAKTLSNLSYSANFSEGTFAEGWAVAGQAGSMVENALLAACIALAAWCFDSRRRFLRLLIIAMTTQPYLFERGMMGVGEGIGKSIEVAIITGVVIGIPSAERGRASAARVVRRRPRRLDGARRAGVSPAPTPAAPELTR